MNQDQAIDKVRKLLALGDSDNIHESAAAIGRASAIMEQHRITEAMITVDQNEDEPAEQPREWEQPLDSTKGQLWRGRLAMVLTQSHGCALYRSGSDRIVTGTAANAETVRYLYSHCVREIQKLAARQRGNGRTWLNNYRYGCVDAIRDAIKASQTDTRLLMRGEADTPSALVIVENALQRIDAEAKTAKRFMHSKHKLVFQMSSHRVNGSARAAGQRDGARIYKGSPRPSAARQIRG